MADQDMLYMKRALELAARGRGRTSPNPMVGAVVVKEDRIIGEGWHQRAGGPHAEVFALEEAGEAARGAALYVTLEPCSIFGRTPPCAPAVIRSGITRVIIASRDPNPRVDGQGSAALRQAGLVVEEGLLEEEARSLNEVYHKYITTGRPFVLVKVAMSLDGAVAAQSGDARWISGAESRARTHQLRAEYDAILTGSGTVAADDPLLTARSQDPEARQPLRIILDSRGSISATARLVTTAGEFPTLLVTTEQAPPEKIELLKRAGLEALVLESRQGRIPLPELLSELGRRKITGVLVEGGPTLVTAFINEGLFDKLVFFMAPKLLGADARPFYCEIGPPRVNDALTLDIRRVGQCGADVIIEAYPREA